MSASTLKLIAAFCMILDHVAAALFPSDLLIYWVFRSVGRVAFPIFAFLLVEGYLHTKHIRKYMLRLLSVGLVAQVPYMLCFGGPFRLNIFFTLLLGLFSMIGMDFLERRKGRFTFLCFLPLEYFMLASYLLSTDFSYLGVMTIGFMYMWRQNRSESLLAGIICMLITVLQSFLQIFALFAFLFLWRYDGRRGTLCSGRWFYFVYPVHLFIIFIFKFLITL